MGRFNGKNGQSTLRQFLERAYFSMEAYGAAPPGQLYPLPVRNFNFAERVLYGRINKAHHPISLRSPNLDLVPLSTADGSSLVLQSLNFVADAFKGLTSDWEALVFEGRVTEDDPLLTNITPLAAFQDHRGMYRKYQLSLREVFINEYLTQERREGIINFKDFLKLFFQYLTEVSSTIPVTQTGFIPSRFASPMISGLCIDVAALDASNDADKERFITSPNFDYYKLVARNNGFSIDKRVPWRLVADIASPEMLKYSAPYGFETETRILQNYYGRSGGRDIRYIQQMAIDFYNFLAFIQPVIRTGTDLEPNPAERYVCREPISMSEALRGISMYFWVDNYLTIRYNEQRRPVSEGAFSEMKKVCRKFAPSRAGERVCVNYINDRLTIFDNFKGSYARKLLDRRNSANKTNIQPTY